MENEIFDEARKCSQCGIITYCDNCPSCGRKLLRSNKTFWKLRYGKQTAGEEENVSQTKDHYDFQERAQIRDTSRKLHGDTLFNESHVDQDVKRNAYSGINNQKQSKKDPSEKPILIARIVLFIAILIVGIIVAVLFFNKEIGNAMKPESTSILREYSPFVDNQGEIIIEDYEFIKKDAESILSFKNSGDRTYIGDIDLYNEEGSHVGNYSDLVILPHEEFDLTIYSNSIADSYAMTNGQFHKASSKVPNLEYTVYNDYGDMSIYTEREASKEQAEELMLFILESSLYSKYESMFYCEITSSSDVKYEIFVDDVLDVLNVTWRDGSYDDAEEYTIDIPMEFTTMVGGVNL